MKEQDIPYGKIVGFDSLEEMLAYMDAQELAAIERTLDEQWEITWGDYVIRMVEKRLAIFGHILSEGEFLELNANPETPDEETQFELDGLRAQYLAGYRYGIWHSKVEPDGEYGSAHVSTLWRITADEFTIAKRRGWKLTHELADRLVEEMQAIQQRMKDNHEGEEGADEDTR